MKKSLVPVFCILIISVCALTIYSLLYVPIVEVEDIVQEDYSDEIIVVSEESIEGDVDDTIQLDELLTYDLLIPSNLTEEQLASGLLYDLKPLAPYFVEMEILHGINSIHLASIAALESGWGRYRFNKNNIFGFGNCEFSSEYDCIDYVSSYLLDNYLYEDGKYYAGGTTLYHVNHYYNGRESWYNDVTSISSQIIKRVMKNNPDLIIY